jgi:hypothetical protein
MIGFATIGTTLVGFSSYGGDIYNSSDVGDSWNKVGSIGRISYGIVEHGNGLYVATEFGVFYSSDKGATWSSKNENLPDTTITAITATNDELYVSTLAGVYRSLFSNLSVPTEKALIGSNTLTAFPNPFTTETTISFNSPESQPVHFEIYDILGNKIYDAGEKLYSKGENTITLNTSEFPDGFFYGRLTSSIGNAQSIKLFKLRP